VVVTAKEDLAGVSAFLDEGALGDRTLEQVVTLCDQYVRSKTQESSAEAVERGRRFVERTRAQGSVHYRTALLAMAWALRVAGKMPEAKDTYLIARRRCGTDLLCRARIDRVLTDIYMYLGKYTEAERRARMALDTFGRRRLTDDAAKTKVNLANVYHRQDRHRDAYRMYHQAAAHFSRKRNMPAAALCWCNEANTLTQLFRLDEARELYNRARDVFSENGHQLHAAACLYGLAWLNMLAGDFHTALQQLSLCEESYVAAHQPRELLLCQLDRAESYLGLNLFVDARAAAEVAETQAKELSLDYETAKAIFFQGKAAIGLGRIAEARNCLKKAAGYFRKAPNHGFLAAVELTRATIDRSRPVGLKRYKAAARLFKKAQLPLWEAISDFQILSAWPNDDVPIKRLARNPAVRMVPHLSARRYTLMGDREAARQRVGRAVRYWTQAAEILDAVRAKLPPVEMRSAYFALRNDPFKRLIKVQAGRNTEQAAVWSERLKTTGVWATPVELTHDNPVRARIKESLEQLANQVAIASGAPGQESGRRSSLPSHLSKHHRQLEAQIRQDFGSLGSKHSLTHQTNEAIAANLRRVSHRMPIVQLHVGDSQVFAFVHDKGEVRHHVYRDGVTTAGDFVARWRFLVECTLGDRKVTRSADLDEERRLLKRMGDWLLPPLELSPRFKKLLVVPDGPLLSLPWLAIDYYGRPLSADHQIVLAPTVRHHVRAGRQRTRSRKASVFVGQGPGLLHVEREVEALRDRLASLDLALYNPCQRDDWPRDSACQLWHYAGHAHLRADNPFYSSLQLADGAMFAADFRLRNNRVNLVTLAACRTGQHSSLRGKETTGLVRSLIEMGARNVVAANWAVADRSTALWMDTFYEHYVNGKAPVAAGQMAALILRETLPSACHWGSFSVHGAG
jgi:tetratricopeptide (TPR) repeat protein